MSKNGHVDYKKDNVRAETHIAWKPYGYFKTQEEWK